MRETIKQGVRQEKGPTTDNNNNNVGQFDTHPQQKTNKDNWKKIQE